MERVIILQRSATQKVVAALLISEVLCTLIPFFILGAYFDFPDILRKPAQEAFSLFAKNQSVIVPTYYIFLLSALLYIPLAISLKTFLRKQGAKETADWMYTFGIATAIFQAIGFCRWIFVIPYLSSQYQLGHHQETIQLLFELLNRYAGTSIGEHLGFIMMGCWMVFLALSIQNRILKISGLAIGGLLVLSTIEHFGGKLAPLFASINILANVLWTIWIIVMSISILKKN